LKLDTVRRALRLGNRKRAIGSRELASKILAGAQTLVSDVVVPSIFVPYVVERTPELTAFFQSGIIEADAAFNEIAAGGGQTAQMPFWKDITGSSQVLSDTVSLVTKKIGTQTDVCVINNRGDAWSTNDLARYLSGADPMAEIGDLVADYWARDHEHTLINQLNGVFAAGGPVTATNAIDVSTAGTVAAANTLTGKSFINTKQLLGDSAGKLVAMAVHSVVLSSLLMQDLIDFIPVSDARETITVFQGLEVIVDDNMPQGVNTNAWYDTFIFGRGAFAWGASLIDNPVEGGFGTWQTEFTRVPLAGQNVMINRRRFILHPRGVKWLGAAMAGLSPTDAEFATSSNWTPVYFQKNIRIVRIRHNVILS
jgi:hypothetical protein